MIYELSKENINEVYNKINDFIDKPLIIYEMRNSKKNEYAKKIRREGVIHYATIDGVVYRAIRLVVRIKNASSYDDKYMNIYALPHRPIIFHDNSVMCINDLESSNGTCGDTWYTFMKEEAV